MGLAALQLDAVRPFEETDGQIVTLSPANSDLPATFGEPKVDLQRLLGNISKVAGLLSKQRERANAFEKRAQTSEEVSREAIRKISDLEGKLKDALEDAETERRRATEMRTRSAEVVERSRAMLNEASERLRNAEERASRAESHFATLREALERQFGRETT